jgi:membrane protease YdiL (CAAX protease family)
MGEAGTDSEAVAPSLAQENVGKRPKLPRVWTVLLAFVVGFLTTMGIGVGEAIVLMAREVANGKSLSDPTPVVAEVARLLATPTFLLINVAASSLTLVGLAGVLAALSPTPWLDRLRARKSPLAIWTLVVAASTCLALSSWSSSVLEFLHWGQTGALKAIADAFNEASPGFLLVGILVIGVGGGVSEEIFFRGYFQSRVVARWGRWPGIWLTAACFALMHLDLAQGLWALAVGVFLGWVTERTGSIWPAAFLHVVNNSASVLLSAGRVRSTTSSTRDWLLMLAALGLTATGVVCLNRSLPRDGAAQRPLALLGR